MDKDNNVDVSVYQGEEKRKSCGTLNLTYGLEQSDQIYTLLCNTEGDTVKLSKDHGTIVVLEVAVTSICTEYLLILSSNLLKNCIKCACFPCFDPTIMSSIM